MPKENIHASDQTERAGRPEDSATGRGSPADEAGVATAKLFHALTIDNARMLRLDGKIGTVQAGKTANLLLLRADPLKDVTAFDTIETVFLHGRPIRRGELSARNAR